MAVGTGSYQTQRGLAMQPLPWMKGHHHEPKRDSRKPKDSVCTPEGCLFPKAPVARATHVGLSLSPRKLYQGTLGYRWFTPRSRLHSDFNYTCATCESKRAIHLVRRGAWLVIAVVTLVGSLMHLKWETIYNPITIKKKKVRDWPG